MTYLAMKNDAEVTKLIPVVFLLHIYVVAGHQLNTDNVVSRCIYTRRQFDAISGIVFILDYLQQLLTN